jgi:serine/threonine protein kinase
MSTMPRYDVEHYNDKVDRLFCRPRAPYGRYERIEPTTIVVPDMLVRTVLQRPGMESDRFELSLFDGIDGFAGVLWERAARTLLRLQALNHPGLPEIVSGSFDHEERVAFNLTRERGRPLPADEAVRWAAAQPVEAFEQFSVLLDALSHLHGSRILHRNLTLGALRLDQTGGEVALSLSRFEMSTLIGNIIRRISAQDDERKARALVRTVYLSPPDGVALERHLAYLAPELHAYVFDERNHGRRDWDTTDVFGLGVLGWEWFCGGLPELLPEQLAEVAEARGPDRAAALGRLHQAMRSHLANRPDLPGPLTSILGRMLEFRPDGRRTSFELASQVEQDWDAIRGVWEAADGRPYVVAFMPSESDETLWRQRRWISRSPKDPAGRDELKTFLQEELRRAELVWSPVGARGYATGPDRVLGEAQWILVGERAVWFCAYLYEQAMTGERSEDHEHVLVIKYLREFDQAREVAAARPRRRVPRLDLIAYEPGQTVGHLVRDRPSWRPLTESVKKGRQQDPQDAEFLQSLDFLLEYQRVVLDARTYAFVTVGADGGTVLLQRDQSRDDAWCHRSPLLTAYADDRRRRPELGDFVNGLDGEESPKLHVNASDFPSFGNDPVTVVFHDRLDHDTIQVRPLSGAKVPSRGWVRPAEDSGTGPQLARQARARLRLENQAGLIRNLRDPNSLDLGRQRWAVQEGEDCRGNAPQVIRDMLSFQPFYALQGPPGSGKTNAVTLALWHYLEVEAGSRVLVSAQSNFALDHLAERLIKKLPKSTLILREAPEGKEHDVVKNPLVLRHTISKLTDSLAEDVQKTIGERYPKPAADSSEPPIEPQPEPEPEPDRSAAKPSELEVAQAKLAKQWLGLVDSSRVELAERIRVGAGVVLATCSIAATVLEGARENEVFDWVILEEAAKAWPTEVIIPLVFGTRWTLVGDHRQLGAFRSDEVKRFLESLKDDPDERVRIHHERKAKRLEVLNLFGTLFDRPTDEGKASDAVPLGRLTTQFRMHETIAEPVRRVFYQEVPTRLDDDGLPTSFLDSFLPKTSRPHGVTAPSYLAGRPLVWVDTGGDERCRAEGRWHNQGEVQIVEAIVDQMARANQLDQHDGSLVVLTPYREQVRKLEHRGLLRGRVHTVHSFQGREADRVIVSLVRTTRPGASVASSVGHVGQDEVANVLLSRARRLLIVVGAFQHFAEHGGEAWELITRIVRRYGRRVDPTGREVE